MELLIGTSLIAAFIAGIAALFAPCCITVLLPTYLASVFRERRTVFLMTFVFFLGLLTIFLPLGLGFAGLGQLLSSWHNTIFAIGAAALLFLGASLLLGKHFSMPFMPSSSMPIQNATSVFGLGVFSGFATLCCAPVLAGVLALSILPGSIFWGSMYSVAYVLGMTVPLFALASMLDGTQAREKLGFFKKRINYSIGKNKVSLSIADAIAGFTFLAMGLLIFYLAQTNQLVSHSGAQISINIYMAKFTAIAESLAYGVPPAILILAFIAILGAIIITAYKKAKKW